MQAIQARLREFWEKIKAFFKKLNKKIRILLGICLVVAVALVIAAVVRMNQKEYAVLFTGLTSTETSTVLQFLGDNGVTDFKIQDDTILVPKGREDQLQAQLILSGNLTDAYLNYPFYLQNTGMTNTSEEQKRLWLAAQEQRLQAIIQRFDGVREALVTIAPGTDKIYVLEDTATPTTASVVITPVGNRALSEDVVRAIRYTVGHAVEGLTINDISIEDTIGSPYSDYGSSTTMTNQATALKLEYEERISNNVRREIFKGLSSIYGEDNVNVSVLCRVDVSHQVIDKTEYEQPDGSVDGGGLTIGDHLFYERIRDGETPVGGTVGTNTNSDLNPYIPTYPDLADDDNENDTYKGWQVDRSHVVDTINTQEEVLEGRLKDLRVLVTVNQNSESSGAVTIDALRDSVASLAGIGGTEDVLDRVSVIIAPFDGTGTAEPVEVGILGFLTSENSWILYAAIGGLVLFLVLLVLILVLSARRRKQKKLLQEQMMTEEEEMAAAAMAAEAAALLVDAPPTGGADIMEVNTEKSIELRQEVRRFAQNNPEIAAQMVKAWLKGGDDSG